MAHSSDSLFHFTAKEDALIEILRGSFHPRYVEEADINGKLSKNDAWRFAMVCFCDIPLSRIQQHTLTYGEYGLGMTKTWGIRKGLNPVAYLALDSYLMDLIGMLRDSTNKTLRGIENMWDLYAHCKPYFGEMRRGRKKIGGIRFYDEREWRYVAPKADWISPGRAKNRKYMAKMNEQLIATSALNFEPSDVKYIILPRRRDILPFLKKLDKTMPTRSENDARTLASKIITCQDLYSDF